MSDQAPITPEARAAVEDLLDMPPATTGDFDAAVKAVRAHSDERRREFLCGMIDDANVMRELDASLDELEAIYKEHYDAIWLDGSTADDNNRHDADEYHDGYEAGMRYVLAAMVEHGFTLPPLDAGTFDPNVQGATPDVTP